MKHFSRILELELQERLRRNLRYSYRAFAQALDLDIGSLSRFISGKRVPNLKTREKILARLSLSPEQQRLLLDDMSEAEKTKAQPPSSPAEESLSAIDYRKLNDDVFFAISDLAHYSLLQIPETKNNTARLPELSRRLALSQGHIRMALNRLINLGLLRIENQKLVRTEQKLATSDWSVTNSARKNHQKQSLAKAIEAVDEVPVQERAMGSMTMAVSENKLPEAQKIIDRFFDEMSQLLETDTDRRVYQLGVYLYPLEKKNK